MQIQPDQVARMLGAALVFLAVLVLIEVTIPRPRKQDQEQPQDPAVWAVWEEARRITQDAAGGE
jgi:hypothetical protein